jgi:archaellum biogenesis ATPase FlaH
MELSRLGKLALNYAAQGFHVFPLRPLSKLPATSNGFYAATTDEATIRKWWNENEDYNIGLRSGLVSAVTVVDLDGSEGRNSFFDAIPEGETWPETLTVATPSGGCHLYFQYEPSLGQTTKFLPDVDVRNDGGYVVAPGSSIDNGVEQLAYAVELDAPIAPLPFWILELQDKKRVATKAVPEPGLGIGEGSRNDSLARIAGALRRQGIQADAIESTLRHLNEELCEPPLEDEEVSLIAKSVSRYDADETESIENTRPVPAVEYLPSMVEFLKDPRKVKGLSTGIEELDKLMGGGYREGEVIAVNAPAKTGKSTLLRKLVHNLVKQGEPTGYASREEYADREVLPQLLSIELGRSILKSDVEEGKYREILEKWPLFFSPGYGKFPQFVRWLENCKEAGCRVVFVDHLHFMTKDEDYNEAVRVMHEAVKAAKTLDICIVMVIQPKGLQPGQELGLETLRGGAAIGQAITMLLTLERQKEHKNISRIRLVAKRSPLAKLGEFYLELNEESLDMVEVEFHPEEETTPTILQHEPHMIQRAIISKVDLSKRSRKHWGNGEAKEIPPPLED